MTIAGIAAEIIRETDKLRTSYAEKFRDDPDAELLAWLQLAVQREAMVCYLYDDKRRNARLKSNDGEVANVVRDVLTLIWQQESTHAGELAARIVDGIFKGRNGSFDAALAKTRGTMDAAVLDRLTGEEGGIQRALARAATWITGKVVPEMVPPFAGDLPRANLGEFFVLAGALEQTARQSYERIAHLVNDLSLRVNSIQMIGLRKPIKNVGLDEQFHERVFAEMQTWVDAEGRFRPDLQPDSCLRTLKQLLIDTTGIARYQSRGGVRTPVVPTDGGLGSLFADLIVESNLEAGAPSS